MAKLSLHPELMEIWEGLKQEVSDKYRAYEEWGARNREVMEQVPGLGPVLDFTSQIAETPGLEVAFTAPQGMKNMATGIMERLGERAPGEAVRRLISSSVDEFADDVVRPVVGPHPRLDWKNEWSFHGGQKPLVTFPAHTTYSNLEQAYKGGTRLQDVLPYMRERFRLRHELGGHRISDLMTDEEWARIFGSSRPLPRAYDFKMQHGRTPFSKRQIQDMIEDVGDIRQSGLMVPEHVTWPGRGIYHLSDYHPSLKYKEEMIADAVAALGAGGQPGKIYTRSIKDWDPLLQHIDLKATQDEAKELLRLYGRQ